jgi:SAM-dependent methyltransferase
MAHKPGKRSRSRGFGLVGPAMHRRVMQRTAVAGTIKLPAVPALADHYVHMCSRVFEAAGRGFDSDELASARALIQTRLGEAFAGSQRSKLVVSYQAPAGSPLGYEVRAEVQTVGAAYETWIGPTETPLFGAYPDARVLSLANEFSDRAASPVLDIGAGTGRNALALARRGHPVDAVEMTPKFAEMLGAAAAGDELPVRVIERDVFESRADLRSDYRLVVWSEVVPDFRGTAHLRSLFELAGEVLAEGGLLVFNVHLAAQGYTPDRAAREFAEQCYSAIFARAEVAQARAGLPFELVTDDSVHEYERAHLPDGAWPPTLWYSNWVSGKDVYEIEQGESPVEMRWLVYRKSAHRDDPRGQSGRPRRFDPEELRRAVIRRLERRAVASGMITLPAVPGMLDRYVEVCFAVFGALGRQFAPGERAQARELFGRMLSEAYATSARSNIVVSYEAPMGSELKYEVAVEALPLAAAYESWLETLPPPLFGAHPDARVRALAEELAAAGPVLDVGAGTGRHAIYFARRGHPVDAVELTPAFAASLLAEAAQEGLSIRVIPGDVFECSAELGREYRLILLAGVAADFRAFAELRRTFELSAERLAPGGFLALSVHVAVPGYAPDETVRQWAEQCCAMFFTPLELGAAAEGLPLELVTDDSAFDYESRNLPADEWPPTPTCAEWALGQHMFALDRADCPLELRWLVYRKT